MNSGIKFDSNTLVRASAGTGKTNALVDIYLKLLGEGHEPLNIVAVTFTEKAAAEMRERIREAIFERMPALETSEQANWMRALSLLPAAPIATIHGFCASILKEHGFRDQIDPGFSIVDEYWSEELCTRSTLDEIREELLAENVAVRRLFGDLGLQTLIEVIPYSIRWLNSLGVTDDWLISKLGDQEEAALALRAKISGQIEEYGGNHEAIGEQADRVAATSDRSRHPLKNRKDPKALLAQVGQIAGVNDARALSQLVSSARLRFTDAKRALNVMDFDDLLLKTRDLLRDNRQVRALCRDRFVAILVDEFQDTDDVQSEIISLLASEPDNPDQLTGRKLLVVGDPKQSIYRFRRARVSEFFRMRDKIIEASGNQQHLAKNFRSAGPLVKFSNAISSEMLDGKGKPGSNPVATDLSYRVRFSTEDELQVGSSVAFGRIVFIAASEDRRAAQGRADEAKAIARLLLDERAADRIASWNSIGILFRSMTHVDIYLRALQAADIPVYVVHGTGFYETAEVSDLIAALEYVLKPQDRLAEIAVLTSGLVGRSFRELLEMPNEESLGEIFNGWIEQRDAATAAEILEGIVRQTNYDVVAMAQANGQQRVANIGKLIEITRDLAKQGTTSLEDVVRYLRGRVNNPSLREPEAQTIGYEADVVRILTIHQAKGLEFDSVVLPNLSGGIRSNRGARVCHSERWGLIVAPSYGLHRKPLPHSLLLEEHRLEADQEFEEEKRLLYVAITRARSTLILGEGFYSANRPWAKWIRSVVDRLAPGALQRVSVGESPVTENDGSPSVGKDSIPIDVISASALGDSVRLGSALEKVPIVDISTRKVIFNNVEKIAEEFATARSLELTPSQLSRLALCRQDFYRREIRKEIEPGNEHQETQMDLGILAHRFLEAGVAPDKMALQAADLSELSSVFASEDWLQLSKERPEAEVPFMLHLKIDGTDCFVRGRIDAVVLGNQPRVIDYKYSRWWDGCESEYRISMLCYTLAIMKVVDVDRLMGELWFLKEPMKIVKTRFLRDEAEAELANLFRVYQEQISVRVWPKVARLRCDQLSCGFRSSCWEDHATDMAILQNPLEPPI